MFNKRIFSVLLVFSLLLIPLNVNAAANSQFIADEPWFLQYVDWHQDAHVGANASIAHHPRTGKAYISYYDAVDTALKMAHEVAPGTGNCGTGNAWYCETVDRNEDRGLSSSIAVTYVTGGSIFFPYTKIGISYHDSTNKSLRYAQCTLGLGDSVCNWTFNNVDDSGEATKFIGRYSSLAFDEDAVAHIAYNYSWDREIDQSGLRYASYVGVSAGNGADGNWNFDDVGFVYGSLDYGANCSLDFNILGVPVISFYDAENTALALAFGDPSWGPTCGNNNWSCITVDNSSNVGRYSTLHAQKNYNDKNMIAYYDSSHKQVKFAEYVGSGGNCTSALYDCYAVDETADVYPTNFDPIAMDVDTQGYPVIAYMDSATETSPDYLKIARPALTYGLTNGNCGDLHDGDLFQYWNCRTIDPSQTSINKGAFISVGIAPSGLATIAYTEQNLHDDELYLKVAQQRFTTYLPLIKK